MVELDARLFAGMDDPDDVRFSALMTERQFRALGLYVTEYWDGDQLLHLASRVKKSLAKRCDPAQVKRWLFNAWGTEYLLRQGPKTLGDDTALGLQWAFPQAYYAVFSQVHAWMEASGTRIESHSKLQAAFSNEISTGKLPACLSFAATGGRARDTTFINMAEPKGDGSSLDFSASAHDSWRRQICQFLRSTRKLEIEAAREKRKNEFRTKRDNKPKEKLTAREWKIVSDACPPTTVLDLLYRKRIKANYHDVTVFSSASMDGRLVYESLVRVVEALALSHEARVAARDRKLVLDAFDVYRRRCDAPFLTARRESIARSQFSLGDW